jgi:hypothetical protein
MVGHSLLETFPQLAERKLDNYTYARSKDRVVSCLRNFIASGLPATGATKAGRVQSVRFHHWLNQAS